ncbi:hypothetical protein ArsFIN_21010 [Arsenophonus nasoniae]|uniref:Uncharacterized protein n=1 Tax=Arsenophonus nasoniae TaxID=638 RepID=A0A4V1BWV7_9GAMM|nr:hypothetical protein ArsFIN_21010 [Arsenophonus nasoniae]
MKLNIIKLLITTLLFISAAFAFELIVGQIVNDHRKLIHFLSKSDQSKLIHYFTQLLLLSAAYLSIGSFHRLIAVHANDEVNDQA